MVRLDRRKAKQPKGWKAKVTKALPNEAAFKKKAQEFEKLPLDVRRKTGFVAYAKSALPVLTKTKKRGFPEVWRSEKTVKKAIGAMSAGQCAYCQSTVLANQSGQVEHFHPKALFPTKAYAWANYFLSCERCNLSKGDKWPGAGEAGYVRPDREKPEERFIFQSNGHVKARTGDAGAARTCLDFGLDRKGLREGRKALIQMQLGRVRDAIAMVKAGGVISAAKAKKFLVPVLNPYSEAINQNVRRTWNRACPGVKI
ncbi:MAG: HNH endonuclease [Byssovorax sp.]